MLIVFNQFLYVAEFLSRLLESGSQESQKCNTFTSLGLSGLQHRDLSRAFTESRNSEKRRL